VIYPMIRNLSIPSKSEFLDQPPEWNHAYRSHQREPVFPAFPDKRLPEIIKHKGQPEAGALSRRSGAPHRYAVCFHNSLETTDSTWSLVVSRKGIP